MASIYYTESYATPKFSDLWQSALEFTEDMHPLMTEGFDTELTAAQCNRLFYELSARYTDGHIRYTNIMQFKLKLGALLSTYGPLYFQQLALIKDASSRTIEDYLRDGKVLTAVADNNNSMPAVGSENELPYTNAQSVTNSTRAIDVALSVKRGLLRDEVSNAFYNRFKELFISILIPQTPLWFVTEE